MLISSVESTLSGGQKTRLNLARAFYANTSVVILDDPFSSLDACTSSKVMSYILQEARRRRRLILLSTHLIHLLPEVNRVVVMGHGLMTAQGTFDELGRTLEFNDIKAGEAEDEDSEPSDHLLVTMTTPESRDYGNDRECDALNGFIDHKAVWAYAQAFSCPFICLTLVSISFMQFSSMTMDLWLSEWSARSAEISHGHFISVSFVIAAIMMISTAIRALAFAQGAIIAADVFYRQLTWNLLNRPLSFFIGASHGKSINFYCNFHRQLIL